MENGITFVLLWTSFPGKSWTDLSLVNTKPAKL